MTDQKRPSTPLFATRAPRPQNERAGGQGKQRLSISLILLLASLTIGGITVWWSRFYAETETIAISVETVSKTPSDQLEMTGASYTGVTETGVKFNIDADRVIEMSDKAGLMHLFKPDGWFDSDTDGRTTLASEEAVYDSQSGVLDMAGNVRIHQTEQDMLLQSQKMTALIKSGDLTTDMPVRLTSPTINLTSQGMESKNRGEVILFKGQTQARLTQNTKDGDKK